MLPLCSRYVFHTNNIYPGLAELNSLTQSTFIGDGRDRIFAVKKDALSIQKKKIEAGRKKHNILNQQRKTT